MSTSVYGGLVSLVPRSCRQRQLVLLVSTHFALCFLLCSQALMSYIMAPFPVVQPLWPTTEVSQLQFALGGRCLVCSRAGFCAAAVHQRGRLHSLRRVYPMVQTVVKPGNLQLLYKVVDFPVSWSCRFTSPSWRRGCFLWSRPLVGQSRLRSCSTRRMVDVPVVRSHSSRVQTWRR